MLVFDASYKSMVMSAFITKVSPPHRNPNIANWTTRDWEMTAWMLKLVIPHLSQPMELLSLSKEIPDKWAPMYVASGSIALVTYSSFEGVKYSSLEGILH